MQFVANEGDTVTPGTKVAVISKSAVPNEAPASPPEETSKETTPPPAEKDKAEEKSPKVELLKNQEPKFFLWK